MGSGSRAEAPAGTAVGESPGTGLVPGVLEGGEAATVVVEKASWIALPATFLPVFFLALDQLLHLFGKMVRLD